MGIQLKNNASGTLATAINASDTGIVLTTGNGASFPALGATDYFYATLESTGGTTEVVKVTARSGDSLTVVRAQEGSTTNSFAAGSRIELRITAQSVLDVVDQVTAAQVEFTPVGALTATNVQAAITEVVTDLALSSGSSTVGFLQAGTSAVLTTVQAKLRESVSVLDFGADPTGVADSSPAFSLAIATGGLVLIPKGTYIFNSAVAISNPVKLVGAGQSATLLHRNYSPTVDSDGIFNIRDGGSLVSMRDMTLRSLSGQTGGCLLSIVNTNAQAIGQMTFINMGFTTTGSSTHQYTIYMDGTARTSAPIGIRGVDMFACSVFGGGISTLLVKGVLKFSFLGGGCYPAGGAAGSNVRFDGMSGVETQSFQFLPADCSCPISFDRAKLGVFACGVMGAVTNTSNTANIVGYGFTGSLQQNWGNSIFFNTSSGLSLTVNSGITNDGTTSSGGLVMRGQITGYTQTPSGGTKIGHAGIGLTTNTTNGQTFSFDTQSGKLFWIAYGGGEAALVFADFKSATITLLSNPSNKFQASATPGAGFSGIFKSINSHTISVLNNSGVAVNYSICSLGPSLNPVNPS